MKSSLDAAQVERSLATLATANLAFTARYPGEPAARQPVHTVYGGAHLFQADTAPKLGEKAVAHLRRYAPDPETLGRALGIADGLAEPVYQRTLAKLEREPVEDFRIDFEDGY